MLPQHLNTDAMGNLHGTFRTVINWLVMVALGVMFGSLNVHARTTGSDSTHPGGLSLPGSLTPHFLSVLPGQTATLLPDGQWLLVGGRFAGQPVATATLYDSAHERTWGLGGYLNEPRAEHTATLLPDGSVLILGGAGPDGRLARTTERLDPETGLFSVIPLQFPARARHAATLLADGRLLITGGIDGSGRVLDDAVLLSVDTLELTSLISDAPRYDHLSALLPRHQVLVWGGWGPNGQASPFVGQFDPTLAVFQSLKLTEAVQALRFLSDPKPPVVVDTDPTDGATGVAVSRMISVRFSKSMDVTTLNEGTVVLMGPDGLVVTTVTPVEGGLVAFVTPQVQLKPASDYTLIISKARDASGQELQFSTLGFHTEALMEPAATSSTSSSGPDTAPAGSANSSTEATISWSILPSADAVPGDPAAIAASGSPKARGVEEAIGYAAAAADDEEWTPGANQYRGDWRRGLTFKHSRDYARDQSVRRDFLDRLSPRARQAVSARWTTRGVMTDPTTTQPSTISQGAATANQTVVSGQVLRLNGRPLAGVTLRMSGVSTQTGEDGEFLLQGVIPGDQLLDIDGSTAGRDRKTYGRYFYRMEVKQGRNDLDFTIWMPKLDLRHAVRIPSPTKSEVVVTTPKLPGLELHIPAGTVIRDADGNIVTEVSITPVPVDQPPFPMPYQEVPVFYTLQPGGATIESVGAQPSPGASIVYPNYTQQPAGGRVRLFDYDPKGREWYTYTDGTVSADRHTIVPDHPINIYQFTVTSMVYSGGPEPDPGPPCPMSVGHAGFGPGQMCGGGGLPPGAGNAPVPCATSLDPVACRTGLFYESSTDLALADTIGLNLTRHYRQNDANLRSFGIGSGHDLNWYLYYVGQQVVDVEAIDVAFGAGNRVRFLPMGSDRSFKTATFQCTEPGPFYLAQLKLSLTPVREFIVTLQDGRRYGFTYTISRLSWMEDVNGNRISLYRDSSFRLDTAVSPNGRWLEFQYNAPNCSGCISQVRDNAGRTVQYQYDTQGRLTQYTNAAGGVTQYAYDSSHRMTAVTDPRGILKVTNEYDPATGRVTRQTYPDGATGLMAYTLDANGKVLQTDVTHERGDVRRVTYSADGHVNGDILALGMPEEQSVTYTRNAENLVTDVTDGLGRIYHYDLDTRANVTRFTRLFGTPNAIAWNYTYEPTRNQLATATDPLGRVTTYTYDGQGRLTRVEDPLGHRTDMTYTVTGQLQSLTRYRGSAPLATTFTYDGGDLVGITDPLGRTMSVQTDAVGRVTAVTDPLGRTTRTTYDPLGRVTQVMDPQGNTTSYTYDGNGNLLTFADALGHTTTWTYDVRNRPLSKTDALNHSESYAYDEKGNLKFVKDRKNQVTGFEYDLLNRRTRASFGATSLVNPVYQNSVNYVWDKGNRLTRIEDTVAGTITRTYDDRFDTITHEAGPEGGITYTYYTNGLRQTMTPSGGTALAYSFDTANRLTSIVQAQGSGSAQPAIAQTVSFTYDEADRRTQVTLPNGIQILYGWDDASQLSSITYKKSNGTVIGDLTYSYDAAGQRVQIGGSLAASELPIETATSVHDANNRLMNWGGTSLTYDDNGNLIGDGVNSYSWNSRNQLVAIAGATSASFAYDGLGRRRAKTINGVETGYLHDGANPVQEQTGGMARTNLIVGPGLDEWYGRTEGGQSYSYLPDALGSTLALTNEGQATVTGYTYEPYGGMAVSGGATGNAFSYTGREDDGTSLYYYRARYYHPRLGRFVSEDPIGLAGGVNLYTYVDGNPITFYDPYGFAKTPGSVPGQDGYSGYFGGSFGGGGRLVPPNRIDVDSRGNAFPMKTGEYITGSKDGVWKQVRDATCAPTGMRMDGPHSRKTHSDPRALEPHAHVPGVTNTDGTPWLPVKK